MTLAAVWIDHRDDSNEQLCFASDSRTTPGPIDGVTKVVLFGRADLAGVWAGDYRYASLLIAHLDAFFTSTEAMRQRDVDVALALERAGAATRAHLRRTIKTGLSKFKINPGAQTPEPTTLLVGGYSILRQQFRVLRIDYTPLGSGWSVKTQPVDPLVAIYIGDERNSARVRARRARSQMRPTRTDHWHMEPLAAIHRAIVDENKPTIGGVPQLAKVFRHGASAAYGIVDAGTDEVWSRAALVPPRGRMELAVAGRLVDLSAWHLAKGQYLTPST